MSKRKIIPISIILLLVSLFITINSNTLKPIKTEDIASNMVMISTEAENILWKNILPNTRSRIQDFANLGDVTGDGIDDLTIYAGNYFYVLDGINGSIVTSYDAHFPVRFYEIIPDVNFDGGYDLLIAGYNDWEVLDPFTNNPNEMVRIGSGYYYQFITALKSISCVNGSGVGDVIVSGSNIGNSGGVACFDGRGGAPIWERSDLGGCAKGPNNLIIVPDIDGDMIDNVFINTYNGTEQGGHMLNGSNGATIWENSSFSGNVYLIPDISGDGVSDIVTEMSSRFVYVASNNGSLIFQGPTIPNWGWGRFVADITGDGFPDFVNTTEEGTPTLTACNGRTGVVLWNRTTPSGFHFTLEINDVDGDGFPEIGCGTCSGDDSMYCLSGATGNVIWKLNETGSEYGLVFGDINGNGYQEVLNFGGTEIVCLDSNSSGIINVSFDEFYEPDCPDCPNCPNCPDKSDIPTFNLALIIPIIGVIILLRYRMPKKESGS